MHLPESSTEDRTATLRKWPRFPGSDRTEHERECSPCLGPTNRGVSKLGINPATSRPNDNFFFRLPLRNAKGTILGLILPRTHTDRPNRQKGPEATKKRSVGQSHRAIHPIHPRLWNPFTAWPPKGPCTSVQPAGKLPRCIRHRGSTNGRPAAHPPPYPWPGGVSTGPLFLIIFTRSGFCFLTDDYLILIPPWLAGTNSFFSSSHRELLIIHVMSGELTGRRGGADQL